MVDNVTNALILEHLKAIQSKMSVVSFDLSDVKTDVRSMKSHMAAFLQAEVAQYNAIASIQARLDRIEQRLNLQDGP